MPSRANRRRSPRNRPRVKLKWRQFEFDFSLRTHVMGILNVTPDSFSDGGVFFRTEQAIEQARRLASEGADIIDIGGESTRPGSDAVPEDEEITRVVPVIEAISGEGETGIPLSIDTTKSRVAEAALRAGAAMINDISGLMADPDMARVAAAHGVPVVVMHIRGTPKTMQKNTAYQDLMGEIRDRLNRAVERAVTAGVPEDRVLVDPGIGFGKTLKHNLEIIRNLRVLKSLGCPLVLGPSRKSFIGAVLDLPVTDRMEGTAAAVALGIANGADLVRVHDVKAMVRVCRMTDAIVGKGLFQHGG